MTVKTRTRQQQSEWLAREERRRRLIIGSWIAAGVAFIAMLVYLVYREVNPPPKPGEAVPIQGASHVEPGMPHEPYNSDPPSSGPHYASITAAGFYDEAPADEELPHNLEHGYVIIWYNCTGLDDAGCQQLKDDIRSTMGASGLAPQTRLLKLIAVPRPTLDSRVSLTAWGRIMHLDEFDRGAMLDFIRNWRESPQAPEPRAQ